MTNYEKSYWKAVELREKVYEGSIKICKHDRERVLDFLLDIQNVAFEGTFKEKMVCHNHSCLFLKGEKCSSDYYNMIQACAYRIKEEKP